MTESLSYSPPFASNHSPDRSRFLAMAMEHFQFRLPSRELNLCLLCVINALSPFPTHCTVPLFVVANRSRLRAVFCWRPGALFPRDWQRTRTRHWELNCEKIIEYPASHPVLPLHCHESFLVFPNQYQQFPSPYSVAYWSAAKCGLMLLLPLSLFTSLRFP